MAHKKSILCLFSALSRRVGALQISMIIVVVVVVVIIVQVGVVDGWRVGREWVPIQNHSLCVTQK